MPGNEVRNASEKTMVGGPCVGQVCGSLNKRRGEAEAKETEAKNGEGSRTVNPANWGQTVQLRRSIEPCKWGNSLPKKRRWLRKACCDFGAEMEGWKDAIQNSILGHMDPSQGNLRSEDDKDSARMEHFPPSTFFSKKVRIPHLNF